MLSVKVEITLKSSWTRVQCPVAGLLFDGVERLRVSEPGVPADGEVGQTHQVRVRNAERIAGLEIEQALLHASEGGESNVVEGSRLQRVCPADSGGQVRL